jgi:hypothetical protein
LQFLSLPLDASLQKLVEVSPLCNEEVALFRKRVTCSLLLDRAVTRKLATVCFPPVLNTDHPVFNFIDYLRLKKTKVVLQK